MDQKYESLVEKSINIIRQAWILYTNPIILSSSGKDSLVMIEMVRRAFDGIVPFPVVFVDTGFHFKETLEYTKTLAELWDLDMYILRNDKALEEGVSPSTRSKVECCTRLKTDAWVSFMVENEYDLAFRGYRADEHPIRGNKPYFEKREDPPHTRCYPILHWTFDDIWGFIRKVNIPVNPMYDVVIDGKVYKSLGCYPCTFPVHPEERERAGRDNTKENAMKELDRLNY